MAQVVGPAVPGQQVRLSPPATKSTAPTRRSSPEFVHRARIRACLGPFEQARRGASSGGGGSSRGRRSYHRQTERRTPEFGREGGWAMRRAIGQPEGRSEAFARARAQRHKPGTKGSPDGCRRRARAATRTGARWKQSYGELAGKWRGWGGSMGRGERNRREPVTISSPETRQRWGPQRSVRELR